MNPCHPLQLSKWQAIQAGMLYDFTSIEFLEFLHKLVTDFINGTVDPVLDLAKYQDRDVYLTDPALGTRRTSENWANYAWPIFKELQASIAGTLAARRAGHYKRPFITESLRGVEQFSLEWTTQDEEEAFKAAMELIGEVGRCLDDILIDYDESLVNDFYFHYNYELFASRHQRIPKFRVRTDVRARSGEIPPVTGVYVTPDDPNASLQFAYRENEGRALRDANTFNDIGLAALAFVGRKEMWRNTAKMLAFATSQRYASVFHDAIFFYGEPQEDIVPSAVSRMAFTSRVATWYLVEPIAGQFDILDRDDDAQLVHSDQPAPRIVGGDPRAVA